MAMIATRHFDFQAAAAEENKFKEIGGTGLTFWGGLIDAAYHADLKWPACFPLYNRIRRSDPEISVVRQLYAAMVGQCRIEFRTPAKVETPTDDDKRALDFAQSTFIDLE